MVTNKTTGCNNTTPQTKGTSALRREARHKTHNDQTAEDNVSVSLNATAAQVANIHEPNRDKPQTMQTRYDTFSLQVTNALRNKSYGPRKVGGSKEATESRRLSSGNGFKSRNTGA